MTIVIVLLLLFGFAALLVVAVPVLPLLIFASTISVTPSPPGVVPREASFAPHGPLLTDGSQMEQLIRPWIGTPYVFGGNLLTGVDCSGFTVAIYRQLGFALPRTAQTQYNATAHIPASEAQPNDLVFFHSTYDSWPDWISHVGIYMGDGVMVSAITPRLGRQNLNDPYWRKHFVGFGRVRR